MGLNAHDLLPIPLNEETLAHVVARIRTVQDYLERPLVLENPSTYVTFAQSTMSEWEFLTRMAEDADCGLLLDVNNVYVSSVNHDFDPREYIENVPHERIVQCHLAGHTNCRTHLIDTHDDHVIDPVWELYRLAHRRTGGISTLLEWDARIPEFPVVHAEVLKARQYMGTIDGPRPATTTPAASARAARRNRRRLESHRLHRAGDRMKPKPAHLDQIERWMQSVITHPGGVADGVASEGARRHLAVGPGELESVIRPSRQLASEARLEIYVDAYFERLLECLREEFTVTRHAVGDELFDGLAFGYLQQFPSQSYTLNHLGAAFPQFLAAARLHEQSAPAAAPESWPEFVIELAALERLQRDVFDAVGTEGQPVWENRQASELLGRGAEVRLVPAPCLRLFTATHPVHEYWQAVKAELEPAPPQPRESYLAISRRNYFVERLELSSVQYALLERLVAGQSIADAIAAACHTAEPADWLALLHDWFAASAQIALLRRRDDCVPPCGLTIAAARSRKLASHPRRRLHACRIFLLHDPFRE